MEQLLQSDDKMKCGKHGLLRDNLNLTQFVKDDRQLICNQCNHSESNQVKLKVLEEFLKKFNYQINMLTDEYRKTKINLFVAKKIEDQIKKLENEMKDIEQKLKEKQEMNKNMQAFLQNIDCTKLMALLHYIKDQRIEEYKVKDYQQYSIIEKEIQQEKKCNQALNILTKAHNEINQILDNNNNIIIQKPIIHKIHQFDKQVEQDFDEKVQVYDMQMNRTGIYLAVGSSKIEQHDCYVQIWEINGGILRQINSLKGHNREVKTLFFNDEDTLFTGSVDSTIKIWVKQKNQKIWDLSQNLEGHHQLAINCIQLRQSNQNFFASGSEELILWKKDIECNGQWVKDSLFKNNTRIIQALSFNDYGNILVVGSDDRLIQIFEFAYNKWQFKDKEGQENKILSIIQSYQSDLISFQIDGSYTFWNFESINGNLKWKKTKGKLEGQIKKISISLSKKLLSVSYQNKTVKFYQIQNDNKLVEQTNINTEGELIIMSYYSPEREDLRETFVKPNQFIYGIAQQQGLRKTNFIQYQKFAKIFKGKLQVFQERTETE